MLSLSCITCYFVVKKSREMAARRRHKRRKSQLLLDCALRFMVIAALCVFVLGIVRWCSQPAFPKSLFGTIWDRNSKMSSREAPSGASTGFGPRVAAVDITTKDLYDRIGFENRYGGAWTQGWNIKYSGNEWDHEKLKVFVVPHSHNDPGWLHTVEEYYQLHTRKIISNIVQSLTKDHRRKFIWEEVSYLKRWWDDAWQSEKEDFIRLVKNGQLEIVGGGWVMNDEANSHFFAILEQMTAGNLWLLDNIGLAPKNAWAIDPFGHSSAMAYLLKQMGFRNMVIQRTHYEVKKALALDKSLEFYWRQSWDTKNTSDIFCHMMPFYFYDIPHTCGPEPAVCCQFDFWRLPGQSSVLSCPWGTSPQSISPQNVKERAKLLLDQYRKKSTLYRSNTLLVPLGDDFRYANIREAELQFDNYQMLFDYINSHPELMAEVKFGTLDDYFSTLQAEAGKASKRELPGFPSLAGDFFTYADREADYWSGYYVTRPFYKGVDRVLEATLRAANVLLFFTRLQCNCSFISEFAQAVDAASHNLALFQHHDGVTGTARDHVVEDYAMRMHSSLVNLQKPLLASASLLLSTGSEVKEDWFEMEETRSKHNVLPMKQTVKATDQYMHRIALFNSLATLVTQIVTVMTDSPLVCVFDSKLRNIESQASPEWENENVTFITGRHRIQWKASVPALGFQSYLVVSSKSYGSCKGAFLATIKVSSGNFACPEFYECTQQKDDIQISNLHQTIAFAPKKGLLKWIKDHRDEEVTQVEEEVMYYSSQGSGAYLFRPNGKARELLEEGGVVVSVEGPLMQEVYIAPRCNLGDQPVTRSARIFAGQAAIELEYHVSLLGNANFDNKEIISRFKTSINNKRVFYSDLNGYETTRRETYDKIPLQGNYYPMPSLAFMQDGSGLRLSVHSRQAVGVASLGDGWLEMMLDRRIASDDGRGLGQGIMDNRPVNVVFHLLLEKNVSETPEMSAAAPRSPSLLSHTVGAQLNYPLLMFLGTAESVEGVKRDASIGALVPGSSLFPVRVEFPSDLHLVNLKALRPTKQPASDAFEYGCTIFRRGWDESFGKKGYKTMDEQSLNVFNIFRDVTVEDVKLSSVNFVHDEQLQFGYIEQVHRKERMGTITRNGLMDLDSMELQSFKFSAVSNK